jgi:RHS repeat-associated protein
LGTPRTGFSAGNELNLWDSTGSLGQNRQLENVKKPGKSQRVVLDHPSDSEGNECFCPDFTPLWDGCDTGLPLLTTDNNALPGGQVEGFAFDLGGNLVYQTNYNGMVITNQYDELNRLTNQISVNGYQVSYAYDPATGQRVRMTDGSGVTAYGYDRRDRLVLKTVNWNQGPGVSLNYGYDADGNVTNLWSGTAGGVNLAYRYDPLNRLTNVAGQVSRLAEYAYDAVGNLQTAGYGNGVTNRYQYDVLNRLTNLVASTVSGTIARFYYQLGLTGNRTNLSETVNGIGRTYAWKYDALNRLTNETISALGSVGYGYDAVGNRTNRASGISGLATANSSYSANDWLTSDQYDANGNTTNSASVAYRYDVLNRLVDYNHGAVTLGYNGDGQRVVKNVGGAVTYYVVDDRNPSGYAQVLEEITAYAGTTNLTKVYAYGLDLISQEQPGAATNYYGHDGHGSVRYLTDTNGGITDTYTYDAYGNLIATSGSTANNYLYCGEQYDPQLKLYYNRARYLNPDTGRFWTMDTFAGNNEDPLSLHKYLYAQCDPVDLMTQQEKMQ